VKFERSKNKGYSF